MDAILNFFQGIGNAITAVFDFVIGFFQDTVYLIQLTGKVLAQVPGYFSWMPVEVALLIGLIMTVVVLYKILGREG